MAAMGCQQQLHIFLLGEIVIGGIPAINRLLQGITCHYSYDELPVYEAFSTAAQLAQAVRPIQITLARQLRQSGQQYRHIA